MSPHRFELAFQQSTEYIGSIAKIAIGSIARIAGSIPYEMGILHDGAHSGAHLAQLMKSSTLVGRCQLPSVQLPPAPNCSRHRLLRNHYKPSTPPLVHTTIQPPSHSQLSAHNHQRWILNWSCRAILRKHTVPQCHASHNTKRTSLGILHSYRE